MILLVLKVARIVLEAFEALSIVIEASAWALKGNNRIYIKDFVYNSISLRLTTYQNEQL
jgi:hypothetical protein